MILFNSCGEEITDIENAYYLFAESANDATEFADELGDYELFTANGEGLYKFNDNYSYIKVPNFDELCEIVYRVCKY